MGGIHQHKLRRRKLVVRDMRLDSSTLLVRSATDLSKNINFQQYATNLEKFYGYVNAELDIHGMPTHWNIPLFL